MKKLFLAGALAFFVGVSAQSGYPKLGFHLGIPVGDAGGHLQF